MMGAGKSTIATALGTLLGRRVFDLDDEIVALEGRSISDIFAVDGEVEFRRLEMNAFLQLKSDQGAIVALGGGAFCTHELRGEIFRSATSVYLHADVATLIGRLESGRMDRPLLAEAGWVERVVQMYEDRDPIYRSADYVIETAGRTVPEIAKEVIRATA
ncbi:MAG: shikimate kinase [Bradymonadia bacterium]|jgi:shikimate kinase